MMNRFLWLVLIGGLALGGCNGDYSMPDDVTKVQEQAVLNRGAPGPTEMPPGLGEDLPQPPSTQPVKMK